MMIHDDDDAEKDSEVSDADIDDVFEEETEDGELDSELKGPMDEFGGGDDDSRARDWE